jgi:hypothetical protein
MPRPLLSLESLHARFERTGHPSCAFKARALAARLGVDVPEWATLRKSGQHFLDVESLRERHDRDGLPTDRRARLRMLARKRAGASGVPVPAWAVKVPKGPPRAPKARPAPTKARPRPPIATKPRPPVPRRTIGTSEGSIAATHAKPASTPPREIPAPLRAWREALPARRLVQISGERVTLHERGEPSRSFACVAEAIATVVQRATA